MSSTPPFAATLASTEGGQRLLDLLRGRVTLFGALGVVILAAVVWAVFFRSRHRRSYRHHHHHDSEHAAEAESAAAGTHRRRRWRRRREHRPRNPTLAETGGLPPLRIDRSQDPGP